MTNARRGAPNFRPLLLSGLLLVFGTGPGCQLPTNLWPPRAEATNDNRKLSLVEIGERSLELGEKLEDQKLLVGALEAYNRAEWAFNYLQQLTGQTPLLLEDARVSRIRVQAQLAANPTPPTSTSPAP